MKLATGKLFIVISAALLIGISAGVSAAFNAADVSKLKLTKSCSGSCDLSGADLSGLTLSLANVSGANMKNANLRNTNISNANLSGTDLSGAILAGGNFTNSNMNRAILKVAVLSSRTDFTGAQMSGAIWIDGTTCPNGAVGNGNKKPVKP